VRAEYSLPPALSFVPGLSCTDGFKDVEVFLQNRPRPAGGETHERDIIKVLAKLSVLPSMVGLVDPAAVWTLLAEPRTVVTYVARAMSPAAGRILKALAEDSIIGPDDLASLPELTEKHVCAVIYLHLALPLEVDGQRKLKRLRGDALQSYFGSVRSKRQVDGKGRSESGDKKANGWETSTEAMPADRRRSSSAKVTTRPIMSV
jgi:hypothetical protein